MTTTYLTSITKEDIALLKRGDYAIQTKILITDEPFTQNTMAKNVSIDTVNGQTVVSAIPHSAHETTLNLDGRNVITDNDAIKTWEEIEDKYKEDDGFLGQFIARTLTGTLQDISEDFNIENKYLRLFMGITKAGGLFVSSEEDEILVTEDYENVAAREASENDTTWYSLGSFQVQKPDNDAVKDNTKFEAFDLSTLFNTPFNADYTDNDFTMSFKEVTLTGGVFTATALASYICAQVGICFSIIGIGGSEDGIDFPNSNFHIGSNQFVEGETCRDVMKHIASLAYGWCEMGWDDICRITNISTTIPEENDTDLQLTYHDYYSLTTQKEVYGPVNSVYVGPSNIEGEGVEVTSPSPLPDGTEKVQIQIYNNPITYTFELRQQATNNGQCDSLFGVTYTPVEMDTPSHLYLKPKNLIKVSKPDGTEIYTYPFNKTISYNGNIKVKLISTASTKAEEKYGYSNDFYTELTKTNLTVDKQNATIVAQAAQINNQQEIINGVQATLNTQEARIKIITTNIDEETGDITAVRTENGFTFNKDGLNIYTDANSYNTQIDNVGTYYRDGNDIVSQTTKDGSTLKNLNMIGITQYSPDSSGEYGFTDERISINGEYCYATFYNRGD